MIFHHHKAIFFHNPKTGGYSIERALDNVEDRDWKIFHEDVIFGAKGGVMTQHLTPQDVRKLVPEEVFNSYFKFTFVRNPWDRLVSAYFYLQKHYEARFGSFEGCVKYHLDLIRHDKLPKESHFNRQAPFIEGVDFIGRFETLEEDFRTVAQKINFDGKLKRLNISQRPRDYREMFSYSLLEEVEQVFRADIELLNYSF